jgi:hypothetical protein
VPDPGPLVGGLTFPQLQAHSSSAYRPAIGSTVPIVYEVGVGVNHPLPEYTLVRVPKLLFTGIPGNLFPKKLLTV